ncbi:MAG: phage tail tape measure protein [Acutalibacteraceae bacterium]
MRKGGGDTNAEVADMGEAMKYAAPIASSLGISLEETAAAIGIMSDQGIKGSQAGTSLRGALSRLAAPTKAMRSTMEELGVKFFDSKGNMISLSEQVAQLQSKFKGMTQEQKENAIVTLYGKNALSGMQALIDRGPARLPK